MYEHNALGYWSGLFLGLTKVRSSRARCPATDLILSTKTYTGSDMIEILLTGTLNLNKQTKPRPDMFFLRFFSTSAVSGKGIVDRRHELSGLPWTDEPSREKTNNFDF